MPKLKKAIVLVNEALAYYFRHFFVLTGIAIIPAVLRFASLYFYAHKEIEPLPYYYYSSLLFFVLSVVAIPTGLAAILYFLKNEEGIIASYKNAVRSFWSFILVFLLVDVVVVGGFIVFIIPGILLGVWFLFAYYEAVFYERSGVVALLWSRELVRRRFLNIAWRLFVLFVTISIMALVVIACIFFPLRPLLSSTVRYTILGLLLTPFSLVFCSLMYKNLIELQGGERPAPAPTKSFKFAVALFGIVGLPTVLFFSTLQVLYVVTHDDPPPDDSALRLHEQRGGKPPRFKRLVSVS